MYVQSVVLVFLAVAPCFQSSWQLPFAFITPNVLFLSDFLVNWYHWQCRFLFRVSAVIMKRRMFRSQTVKVYEAFYSNPSLSALSRRKQKWNSISFSCRDLSSHQDLAEAILDCFSSPSEEIKSAASFALGSCDQHGYIKINTESTIDIKTKMRSRLGEYYNWHRHWC